MTNTTHNEDPAAIEKDIRRTQEDMSRTVDKIGDQMSLRNIFNALLDKADQNDVDARYLVEGARRNPMALGLIAAGAIWLVSDKDAKFPTFKSRKSSGSDDLDLDSHDIHHRDWVTHMSSVEMREGEDHTAYQRRRDLARANFLMCERRPDEDDQGFRQRLDDLTETFREKRRAWSDSASNAGTATAQTARRAASRTQEMYESNPLVGGMLAAAVGAAVGSAIPVSRQEQEKLGSIGAKARDFANEEKEELTSQLRDKKDELIEKADQKVRGPAGQGQDGLSSSGRQSSGSERAEPRLQPSFDRSTS